MKRSPVLISALVAVLIGGGVAYFLGGREARTPQAEKASPPAASDARSSDRTPVEATESSTPERNRQLALEIERALVARDPHQRETAFNILLPELLRAEPARLVDIVSRQQFGEARDALRDEVARQWITLDRDATIEWIGSLDEAERRASATIAMRTLSASDPAQALHVADLFGVGRDDGSLEYIVQIWATENPNAAMRWIDSQPPNDPRTAPLKARIEQVRAQKGETSQ